MSSLLPENAELGDTPSGSDSGTRACGMDERDPVSAPPPSVTGVCRAWQARSQATWEERWVGSLCRHMVGWGRNVVIWCAYGDKGLKEMPDILLCRGDEAMVDEMGQTSLVHTVPCDSVPLCGSD